MSVIDVFECRTADDVRRIARKVHKRRVAMWARPVVPRLKPTPPPVRIVVEVHEEQEAETKIEVIETPPTLSLMMILRAVARAFGISKEDLTGQGRVAHFVLPRQAFYLLAHMMLGASLPRIGRAAGGRDHTTALHGIKKMQWLRDKLIQAGLTREDPLERWIEHAVKFCRQPRSTDDGPDQKAICSDQDGHGGSPGMA